MKNITHPFVKYGLAVVMRENNLSSPSEITRSQLLRELENCKNHYRVKASSVSENNRKVKFIYTDQQQGDTNKGVFLAPNILSTDKEARHVYSSFEKVIGELKKDESTNINLTRGITTVTGEYLNFGPKTAGRGKPSVPIEIAALSLITNTTEKKPGLNLKSKNFENIAIIPDLELEEMIDFINLFERMKNESTEELMVGSLDNNSKPYRPKLFDGNFPFAPRSNNLGTTALLGAIGAWAKNATDIKWARKVLSSLVNKSIYLIGTNSFQTFKYNHFIIELAKENQLNTIIDSAYYTVLYNQGPRNPKNRREYDTYDLFLSRLLQLFSVSTFKDFLSFRAEYPNQFKLLLNKYFINMEKIKPEVVKSARELGKWLNYAAYKVADSNIEKDVQNRYEEVSKLKSKSLVEIESSIFSARDGSSLIFQAITRAGRASGLDAPAEAELFMTETSTGDLSLEDAKHLLIAFSRVRNKFEHRETPISQNGGSPKEDNQDDFSDAQE